MGDLGEAEDLAAATLAAIDAYPRIDAIRAADRERVASDLAGLREHLPDPGAWRSYPNPNEYVACQAEGCSCPERYDDGPEWPCPDARRYLAGLRRTAALYGVQK